jgi:hypothetical protein
MDESGVPKILNSLKKLEDAEVSMAAIERPGISGIYHIRENFTPLILLSDPNFYKYKLQVL